MYKHWKACIAGGFVGWLLAAPGYLQGLWGLFGLLLEPNWPRHGGQPGGRGGSRSPQLGLELPITKLGTSSWCFSVQGSFYSFWLRHLGPAWRSHSWDLRQSFPFPLLRRGFCSHEGCFCSRLDSPFLVSPFWGKGPVNAGGGTVQEQKHSMGAGSPGEAPLCLSSCLLRCFWLRVSKS